MGNDEEVTSGLGPGSGYVTPHGIAAISAYLVVLALGLGWILMELWPSCEVAPAVETPSAAAPAALTVTAIAPPSGTTAGETSVVVSGTGFLKETKVLFGDTVARVTEVTPTALKVVTPKHAAGAVDLVAENPDKKRHTLTGGFFYVDSTPTPGPGPTVTSISPATGPLNGGQSVTITGSRLSGVATVTFGGTPAASVRILNDAMLTAVTAPHAEGKVDVAVSDGRNVTVSAAEYDFTCGVGSPYRVFVMVVLAGALGGTVHAIRSLFWYVGNRDLRWSWALMYVLLPLSGAAIAVVFFLIASVGLYNTTQGTGSLVLVGLAALVGMFSVQAAEKLKNIAEGLLAAAPKGSNRLDPDKQATALAVTNADPPQGPAAGGTPVTITGSGFAVGATVKFGDTAGTNPVVEKPTTIKVTSPQHAAGAVEVVVTNPDKKSAGKRDAYTYVP
jgi:hypothetical protein